MSGSKKIRFAEDVTIRDIADTHKLLRDALSKNDDVVVNASAIKEADVCFVQLMESARKTATSGKKHLSMEVPAAGALLEVLQRGGFLESRENISFWLCE